MTTTLRSPDEIERIRTAGRLAAEVLDLITDHVVPGVTTAELDRICHEHITSDQQATPAPLNYQGFPKSICTSINHVVCHGIPSEKRLKRGDIVNIDVTVIKDGYFGDSSRMYTVGEVSAPARRICDVARESLMRGLAAVRAGATLGDIGHAIQSYAEAERCSVVREYCGHGIGTAFHEEPKVLHYGKPGEGLRLQTGMVFTVEPMINLGKRKVKVLGDQWTVITSDRSLSAQWEHTIAVTENGCDILTLGASGQP
ncbi:MAG: type I methionyl aminopeptidase [Pseudomonadota bacterium]